MNISGVYCKKVDSIKTDFDYYISKCGKVFNCKLRKLSNRMGGYKKQYCRTVFRCNGKNKDVYVHRLVLQEFYGPCPKGMECAHLDGNPLNNNLTNLKWVLPKENSQMKIIHGTSGVGEKNTMAKISDIDAEFIVRNYSKLTNKILSEKFSISISNVSMIASGRTRKKDSLNHFYVKNKLIAQKRILEALKYGKN